MLHIEIPEDAVSPEYRGVLKEYSHAARIPGFRKGKAPESVVEKRYEAEIHQDTKDRLVPRAYREALDSRGIRPVAIIEVSDVELAKGRGLTFKATVDVAPDFKLPRYRKIALRGEKHDVADKDVEDALQRTRERFGRFEDVEGREVREGDLVNVDYSGTIDGSPVSDIAPDCRGIGGGTDFWALAGDPEFLPGFAKGIAGAAIGDVKTMDVVFSHDYHVASVAGRNAVYEFTVKALRERRIPELDEEFLKRMGAESVEVPQTSQTKKLSGRAQSAVAASVDPRMMSPPIVGVPSLWACSEYRGGASSFRSYWRTLSRFRCSITHGPATRPIRNAVPAAATERTVM